MTGVLVTGAGGFIGGKLGPALAAKGMRVVGCSLDDEPRPGYAAMHAVTLADSLDPVLAAERFDAVVHLANHVGPDEYRINVEGTTRWLEQAEAHGVGLQIFMSSLSAKEGALSDYGRAKYALEKPVLDRNGVVLRLGVVVGNGGMFARMKESLRRAPVVPLLDGGRSRVNVLGVDTLCNMIRDCIAAGGGDWRGRVWHAQQPGSHSLREMMEAIRRHYGYRTLMVPVPTLPILWLLQALEAVGIRSLPVTSTNIKGLRQSGEEEFPSDFMGRGYCVESLDELVERAARDEGGAR